MKLSYLKIVANYVSFLVPILLFGIVLLGNDYREPLVTTPIFLGLVLLMGIVQRWTSVGKKTFLSKTEDSFFCQGQVAHWLRAGGLLALMLCWLLLSDYKYQRMVIFPNQSLSVQLIFGICALLLGWIVIIPPKPKYALVILAIAGVLIRGTGLYQWEINPARRDMLALIISALDAFLSGHSPYGIHQMQAGSEVPLTYPPALWLFHLPAHLIGLDIRWTGIVGDLTVVLGLGSAILKTKTEVFGPVFAALCVYLFSPDIHWNGIYAEPNVDWGVIALLLAGIILKRPQFVGVLLGIALSMRPFNLVLLPFILIWLLRTFGLRTAWRTIVICGLIAAAFYLPFVIADPDAFYLGTVRWLLEYGSVHSKWFWGMIGFSGLLYKYNWVEWMAPLQVTSLGVTVVISAIWAKTERGILLGMSMAYALFVAFNSIIWMSFWIGVCILAISVLGSGASSVINAPKSRRFFKWDWIGMISGSIIVLVSFLVLVALLYQHFSEKGKDELSAYLANQIKIHDTVVDRTGYRVAFLKSPFILNRSQLPRDAVLNSDPFTAVLPQRKIVNPLRSESLWLVERYDLAKGYESLYLGQNGQDGPYEIETKKVFGQYKLTKLKRRAATVGKRLASYPAKLSVTAKINGQKIDAQWKNNNWRFAGNTAGWKKIGPAVARFKRVRTKMLWAHPWNNAQLKLKYDISASSARWMTLYGGLADKKAVWGNSPIVLHIFCDGKLVAKQNFPNASGLYGASFELPAAVHNVALEIQPVKNTARRNFFIDAVFSK